MEKIKPVYIVDTDEMAFMSLLTACRDCKYIRDVQQARYYRLGDTSPDARCALLGVPVSSHVGTCIGFRKAFRVRWESFWLHIRWKLRDAYWVIRHRVVPRNRYHVVNTGLPPGYYDSDTRILAAILEETTRFVARQEDPKYTWRSDWTDTEAHRKAWAAFKAAAEFWAEYKGKDTWGDREDEGASQAIAVVKDVLDNIFYMWD